VNPPTDDAAGRAAVPVREARQRWRLTFRMTALAAEAGGGRAREAVEAWQRALMASGLPVVTTDEAGERPRFALGAVLPAGTAGEAELAEVWLWDRRATWQVREALTGVDLPAGVEVVGLEDVWLGAPALPGRVAAADHRVTLAGAPDVAAVEVATAMLGAATSLPREREKGGSVKRYDLRPLLDWVRVDDAGPPLVLRLRTRIHPELGAGRPDEVLATLGEAAGLPLEAADVVRERLILADEL
jgi:hypothetical protein